MAKYLERDSNFARLNANIVANAKMPNGKCKMNKTELVNLLEAMFLNGEHLMLSTVRMILQECETVTREELVADLIELETAVYNQSQNNKILKSKCRTQYVEDLYKQNTVMTVKGV
jgi:hypothetical protein